MAVILELPFNICAWISAAVIIVYTLLGGLYSVAYTDVVQLVLIFISLVTSQTHTHTMHLHKKQKNSRVQNHCLQEETKAFSQFYTVQIFSVSLVYSGCVSPSS